MKKKGFIVHGVCAPDDVSRELLTSESISMHAIHMTREITPVKDLLALYYLCRLFRRLKPTIVHTSTPKGGLLGILAARLTQVPIVIYTMRGLRFTTARGFKRRALIWFERTCCHLADRIFATSFSTLRSAVEQRVARKGKIFVLCSGTGDGINAIGRFNPVTLPPGTREDLRAEYGIPPDSIVIGYAGRIVREKGLVELEGAWQVLRVKFSSLYLLLVGPLESHDPVPPSVLARLRGDPRVRFTGMVRDMPRHYAAMDILTLPSYREGFGLTPLEAGAMEVPSVVTRIDGLVEAVIDGATGLLVSPKDHHALAKALEILILKPETRARMGKAARHRIVQDFNPQIIWQALYENYCELLADKGLHGPNEVKPRYVH